MKLLWNKNSQNKNLAGIRGNKFVFNEEPEDGIRHILNFANTNEQVDNPAYTAQAELRAEVREAASVNFGRQDNNYTTPGSLESFLMSEHNGRLPAQIRMLLTPKNTMGRRLEGGRELENVATGIGTNGRYTDIENQLNQVTGNDTYSFIRSGGRRNRMAGASLYSLYAMEPHIEKIDKELRSDIKIGGAQNEKAMKKGTPITKFMRKAAAWVKAPLHRTINRWNSNRLKNTSENLLADLQKSRTVLEHEIARIALNTQAYQAGLTTESRNENNNAMTFQDFINNVVAHPNDFLTTNGPVFNGYNFEVATGSQNRRHVMDMILIHHTKKVVEAEQTRASHQDMTSTAEKLLRTNSNVSGQIAGITSIPTDILRQLPSSTEADNAESREITENDLIGGIEENIIRIHNLDPAYHHPNPEFDINNIVYAGAESDMSEHAKLAYLLNYMQNTLSANFLLQFDQEVTNDIHHYMKDAEVEAKEDLLSPAELIKLKTDSAELILSARNALTACNVLDTYFPVANQADLIPIGLPPIEKFIKDFNELNIKELIEKIEPKENRGVFQGFLSKMTNYHSKLEKVIKDSRDGIQDPPVAISSAIIPSEVKLVAGDSIERALNYLEDPANPNRIDAFTLPASARRGQDINSIIRRRLSAGHSKESAEEYTKALKYNADWQWQHWQNNAEQGDIISPIQISNANNSSIITPGAMAPTLNNIQVVKNRGDDLILQGDAANPHIYILAKYDQDRNPTDELRLYEFPRVGGIDDIQTTTSLKNADNNYTVLNLSAA